MHDPIAAAHVDHAITSRRSVRRFLSKPVPKKTVEELLAIASRAPSGTNVQPWKVYALAGKAKDELSAAILAKHNSTGMDGRENDYYPTEWADPWLSRRRKIGFDLYGLLGIGKEQTATRKFNEILYALLLEARYDKRTILEAYFNQEGLGQRGAQAIRGVAAASEFWFGRELRDLSSEQIALMIGMVKGPSWYNPRRNPERALERRNFVLGEMHETGLIDDAEYRRAVKAPLGVTENAGNVAANRFPSYVDLVRRQLARDYPADSISGAGLSVMSGMSPSAQGYAEGAVARTLKSVGSKGRPPLQAGLVMTDVHNGDVLAVVGSRNFTEQGFNRAVDAKRPVGSLLKPLVYLLALAQPGTWSLATPVDDGPVTVTLPNGRSWSPGNSDGQSHGVVSLGDALAMSYNQATVRVGMAVGPERLSELLMVLAGLRAPANPSLILGSVDLSPFAMAQVYQFLSSGGQIQPLRAVRGVLGPDDTLVRWGGEEFLVVFRPMPNRHLPMLGERICQAVSTHRFDVGSEEPLKLTCSVGFVECPLFRDARGGLGWEQMIELAGRALYFVKTHGRNGWAAYRARGDTDLGGLQAALAGDPERLVERLDLVGSAHLHPPGGSPAP